MRYFSQLHTSHILFIALVAGGITFPNEIESALRSSTSWFSHNFGWLVMLACAYFLGLCIYFAFSRYGHLRLGGPNERPQFHTLSWLAMLFAAGMGSGLVFYGAAEPLIHFMQPPPGLEAAQDGPEAARRAFAITFFHWGFHAWAIYAMAALSIAYFAFHRDTPMLPSIPITRNPILREGINGMAIVAVVFGIVSSLCQAVTQLTEGLHQQLNIAVGDAGGTSGLSLIVLAALFVCYMLSASTGLNKGIKILSDINISIALLLMAFILLAGPSLFIMESFVSGIGDYLDKFISLTFNVRHFSDPTGWTESWTITYLLWWVAWGPFVGVFIARISRGRTIREFLLGVIIVPTVFCALWFAALGGTVISLEMFDIPGFGAVVSEPERTTFAMLDHLPLAEITPIIVLFLLFIFLVTSADSGTFVLSMFTSGGNTNPSQKQRLFWGTVIGVITAGALMSGGGIHFFRAVAVAGGMPYLFVMLWQTVGLIKATRADAAEEHI